MGSNPHVLRPIDDEEKWVIHIMEGLASDPIPTADRPPSIFMASSPLRSLKHEAFIPQVVAIGPYHCDIGPHHSSFPANQESDRYKAIAAKEMERHKIMATKQVAKTFKSGFNISSLTDKFLQMTERVRDEYDTDLACSQKDAKLAYMLALDASFVIEVLRSTYAESEHTNLHGDGDGDGGGALSFDSYYCSRFPLPLRKSILQDFVLLENQIPLFLLLEIISMDKSCNESNSCESVLASLFIKLASEVLPFYLNLDESYQCIKQHIGEKKHLLDCLYAVITHAETPTTKADLELKPSHFPRAVDLHNSGIKFMPVERGNMVAVTFDPVKAILHVPKIRVGDDTERLFRNLIAYESHLIDNVHVLSYLRFMNNLVDTPEDVALLTRKGIITEDIGSDEEVAHMWNNLCLNTSRVCSKKYEVVAKQLVKHCDRKLNAWKAEFMRSYFSKPWLLVSLLSGAALLVMTLIILIYTIDLYYKHEG